MEISETEAKCALVWRLCRRHTWGNPIPGPDLVDLALKDSDQGEARRDLLHDLLNEPYIERTREGFAVKNNPDAQAQAAVRLESVCGYSRIQIEATLSRFQQAGGFSSYPVDEIEARLEDWD